MREAIKTIPESVLTLLRHRWRLPDGYWAFESVFRGEGDLDEYRRDRQRRPSYYFVGQGRDRKTEWDKFAHTEALDLIRDRVFGDVAEDQGSRVCINEHAVHGGSATDHPHFSRHDADQHSGCLNSEPDRRPRRAAMSVRH